IGAAVAPAPVDRAMLEADVAAFAGNTADKDTALVAALEKVDRTKALWFVGSGAGTPASAQLGQISGTFDIANGLAIHVAAGLKATALADKTEQGIGDAKKHSDEIGGAAAEVVKSLRVSRRGDTVRVAITISNAQLEAIMQQLGPMLGGMGKPQ